MEYQELYYPAETAAGPGSLRAAADFALKNEYKHALIVTDKDFAELQTFQMLITLLKEERISYTVFDGVIPNPPAECADEAAEFFRESEADFIIAIGGGSSIDTAKAASLAAANGGSVRHYFGINRSLKRGIPLIAVATTAGTGAEMTRFFVITDRKAGKKDIVIDNNCLPRLAISDPCLMTGLPAEITAATGLDALTHAMEAYCAVNHSPFTDGAALQAVELIYKALPMALKYPENLNARTDLCKGASLAGFAFSNSGLGLMHSIGFSIENFVNVPHGQAVGMVMPYVLNFNRKAAGERIADIGGACGISDEVTLGAKTVKLMTDFVARMPIPTLKETGFSPGDTAALAEMSLENPTLGTNPAEPSPSEMAALIEDIYCG